MDNKEFKITELYLASDKNGKYFYGEIVRNNDFIFGKIYIKQHIILSRGKKINVLSQNLDDTVNLILTQNILNLPKNDFILGKFILNLN